jgi:hypothetical protein
MPIALGDPGVFVCTIDDGMPRPPAPAPQPRPLRMIRPGIWLVLALCPHCIYPARYCHDHDAANWWLTKWRR